MNNEQYPTDPKLAWAKIHLHQSSVEINRAGRAELLRVPGIGPKTAQAIIAARRLGRIGDLQQLKQLRVQTTRAAPFILLDGRQPGYQMELAGLSTASQQLRPIDTGPDQ